MTDDLLQDQEQKTYLDRLVGEGQKFKSPEDLAKGKYLADEYINTLESQLDDYRSEILKLRETNVAQTKLKDLVDQLGKPQERDATIVEEKKPTLDPRQFADLIDTRIQEREETKKQADNYNFVKNKLEERYGKDYQKALEDHITQLDISPAELNRMAKTNPKTLVKVLGLDQQQQETFQAPPGTRVRTDSFKPVQEERTWAWYQKLKQSDPKKYYHPQTNVQMHRDMQTLGDRFKDADFNAYGEDYRIRY